MGQASFISRDALRIKGKDVDDTNISNDRVLVYKSASGNLEYEDQAGGGADPTAIHDNVAGEINAITEKASPVSADIIVIEDSEATWNKKKVQIGNLPGGGANDKVKVSSDDTTEDYLYNKVVSDDMTITEVSPGGNEDLKINHGSSQLCTHTHVEADITDLDHTDSDAIHDNIAGEINAITEKASPVDADLLLIEDSADSNNKKKIQIGNIPSLGRDEDAIHDNVNDEIHQVTVKSASVDNDVVLMEDSESLWAKKSVTLGEIRDHDPKSHTHVEADITDLDHYDANAFHDDESGEISALTQTSLLQVNDYYLCEVGVSGYEKRRVPARVLGMISISNDDNAPAYVENKIVSDDLTISVVNPGSAEDLKINHGSSQLCTHTHVEADITDLDHTDSDAIHDNVAGEINAITEKGSPVSADLLLIEDSEATNNKKKIQIGNIPGLGTDSDAIHDNVAGEINAITEKASPVSADLILIEDSEATNNKKKVQIGNLPGGGANDKVKVSSDDTTEDYLFNKVVSDDLTLSEVGGGSNEDLKINHGSSQLCTHTHVEADITDLDHTDSDAIHDNVASEISAITEKTSPVSADLIIIEDTADSNNKKRVQIGNLLYKTTIPYSWSSEEDTDLAVVTGKHRIPITFVTAPSSITIKGARAMVGTAPTGASIIIDINKNGTTIYTTQANRPTISAGANDSGAPATPNVTSLSVGDYLTMDIDQIGSGTPGQNLTVALEVEIVY